MRFKAKPSQIMRVVMAQWIGCQRVIYNGKCVEDKLFASERRLQIQSGEEDITTPLDRCYSQFKSKEQTPWLYDVPSQILRNGADRWMDAKQRQLKGLAKAPKVRNRGNFNSVLISSELFRFKERVDAQGEVHQDLEIGTLAHPIGVLDFHAHRPYGLPKQITVRRTGRHWWVSFSYAYDPSVGLEDGFDLVVRNDAELAYELNALSDAELSLSTLGLDRNVKDNCVATSDGRFYALSETKKERIRRKEIGAVRLQRQFARNKKGSKKSAKTRNRLAGKHAYKSDVLRDFGHQTSHSVVTDVANDDRPPSLIVLEGLQIANMVRRPKAKQDLVTGKWLKNHAAQKAGLNKAILSSCWGAIALQVKYKALKRAADPTGQALVVFVPPAYSSQECSRCAHTQAENRRSQRFFCQRCGHRAHADTNASQVIKGRGIRAVREQTVVVKAVKQCAYKKRKISGRESSGVPVDGDVSQSKAKAKPLQCQKKQENLGTKRPDAPTTDAPAS